MPKLVLPLVIALADQALVFWISRFHQEWINGEPIRFLNILPLPLSFSLAGLAVLVLFWHKKTDPAYTLPFALLGGGVLSNTLSFLWYGKIIDYLPVFTWYSNLADGYIIVGCVTAGLLLLFRRENALDQ